MKNIILVFLFSNLLFATGTFKAKDDGSPQNQIQELKEQRKEIQKQLEKIPKLQEALIKYQKIIERSSKRQRKMAKLYFKSRKICEIMKAKNELKGRSYKSIDRSYKICKEKINGKSSVFKQHGKFMTDIKEFKEVVKKAIVEAGDLIDQKDVFLLESEYTDEAINMLQEQIDNEN